jgi:hypothetical protein
MDLLDTAALRTIETELGRRIVGEYQLDLSALVLDMTNFATFIDTANGKAPIAQRGKAKQKRTDLRLVGLALVITRDGGVPLVSHAYPGDRPDVTQFSDVIDELVARYRQLVQTVESVTVVYDAGQNSAANHEKLEDTGIGFVGSLPPGDHPELLALGRARFHDVDPVRYPGVTCVDTTVTALGVTRRGAHPLTDAARQAVPRVRPDPGQSRTEVDEPASGPRPREDPPQQNGRPTTDRHHPETAVGQPGHHRHPDR